MGELVIDGLAPALWTDAPRIGILRHGDALD